MNENGKISKGHVQRDAYLYIRQSSLQQTTHNTESTARQYRFRERARALGCPVEATGSSSSGLEHTAACCRSYT